MAASRDNSFLFSLKELEQIERGRVARERTAEEARREAERRAFLEQEKAARETEAKRLEEEERRKRIDEARQREEMARLQAIRQAVLERDRVEVDARIRLENERAKDSRELLLESARQDASRRRYRFLIAMSGAVALAAIALGAFVSVDLRNRMRLEGARGEVEDAERANHRLTLGALSTARAEVKSLEEQIERLTAAAGRPSSEVPSVTPLPPRRPNTVSSTATTTRRGAPHRDCGLDGDPLNGCLPTR